MPGGTGHISPRRLFSSIPEQSYRDYLEALPPVGMTTVGNTQSFKMSERRFGQVTLICVKVGRCYFKFHDRITLTHSQVMDKVHAYLNTLQGSPGPDPAWRCPGRAFRPNLDLDSALRFEAFFMGGFGLL